MPLDDLKRKLAGSPASKPTRPPEDQSFLDQFNQAGTDLFTSFDDIGTGLVVGARRDPILGLTMNKIADFAPGLSQADLDEMERQIAGSTPANVAAFVGEWAPMLVGFGAAGAAGKVLGRSVLKASGGRLAEKATERFAKGQFSGPIRAAEAAGSSAAVGGLAGAEEAARGGDLPDVAKHAALGAVLTGVGEGALIGLGRLSPRARAARVPEEQKREALAVFRREVKEPVFREQGRQLLARERATTKKLTKITEELNELLEVNKNALRLAGVEVTGLKAGDLSGLGARLLEPRRAALRKRQQVSSILKETKGKLTSDQRLKLQEVLGREVGSRTTAKAAAKEGLEGTLPVALGKQVGVLAKEKLHLIRAQGKLQASRKALIITRDEEPLTSDVWRTVPPNHKGRLGAARRAIFGKFLQSPEATARQLGVTGATLIRKELTVEAEEFLTQTLMPGEVLQIANRLAKAVGRPAFGARTPTSKMSKVLKDVLSLADDTKGGIQAVRRQFGNEAASVLEDLNRINTQRYAPVEAMGGAPSLTKTTLGEGMFWPQVHRDMPDGALDDAYAKFLGTQGLNRSQAEQLIAQTFTKPSGLQKVGSLDHQRNIPGSLASKIDGGLPMDDYFTGLQRYWEDIASRTIRGRAYGADDSVRNALVRAAEKEGADPKAVQMLLDTFRGNKATDYWGRQAAKTITSIQAATKLTFSVIENMTQPANNAVLFGLTRGVKGFYGGLRETKELGQSHIPKLYAIGESQVESMNRVLLHTSNRSWIDRLSQQLMRPFSAVERLNRRAGAHTASIAIFDDILKGAGGRLRGARLAATRRRFADLGVDYDKTVAFVRRDLQDNPTSSVVDSVQRAFDDIAPDALSRAQFFGAQLGQFIPTRATVPPFAQTPFGRVLYQFKHFVTRQGVLIRDQILGEAALGNHKPLATFLGLYGVTGEAAITLRKTLAGQERESDGMYRILEDFAYVGGSSLFMSAVISSQYAGSLPDLVLGPTFSDVFNVGEDVLSANPKGVLEHVGRLPIVTATRRMFEGAAVGLGGLEEYLDIDLAPSPKAATLDELRQRIREGR